MKDHCVGGDNAGAICTDNTPCTGGGFCSVGVQPCPICAGDGKCHAGPNSGNGCTPGTQLVMGPQWPTSQDCPPTGSPIGNLPIPYLLITGTSSKTAVDHGSQTNVFCGFCKDAANTGCIEGDPKNGCPHNDPNSTCTAALTPFPCCTGAGTGTCQGCTGAGAPFPCCTGTGTGTCDPQTVTPCTTAADCTDATFPDCGQRTGGAFGSQTARTLTENGSPAGALSTGGAAASATLVSVFCIPPTFNPVIDASGSLPGPGAASLQGKAQLLLLPPTTTTTTTSTTTTTT